jgi:hypothetical protein
MALAVSLRGVPGESGLFEATAATADSITDQPNVKA